jgi:acyloxyacyl hydrolase
MRTLRGYAWRGADCNDQNADIYAGRSKTTLGPNVDHDCNGISGTDSKTGKSWEDVLCANTTRMGTILLGDSAGAHFHVPPSWVNSTEIDADVYLNLLQVAENEIDWPGMSAGTGYHKMTNYNGHPVGPVDSGYLRARRANRCNHRDFQSIAVDGARSSSMLSNIIHSMARSKNDHPATVTYALIGNDVCNGHPWNRGTTPAEFKKNVLGALAYLDDHLAPKSHVVMIGLVDGRILFEEMGHRIHPIGALHRNVQTVNFYDFLNCLGISPCWGWMNSNPAARNFTSKNAAELNAVYEEIVANYSGKFKNFDIHYYDCPMKDVMAMWKKTGKPAWMLIEPVDGFHPTQYAEELTTKVMEAQYAKDKILPEVNPNNAQIEKLFGDQGGYIPKGTL